MDTTPSQTETQALSRAEKIKALKIKIEALTRAALEPELEDMGGGGKPPAMRMSVVGTSYIETCCDEALALVDELAGEIEALRANGEILHKALQMAMTQEYNNQQDAFGGSAMTIADACEMWIEDAQEHLHQSALTRQEDDHAS